jgi:hypothetical protein
VAGKPPAIGEAATLHFGQSRMLLFDPETERALYGPNGA